ncbi:MAG: aspartyl/asparaginyl beta-hydroxylase domain-containing protein [Burkholderiales bacterium]|nr:aspartyl/asparaginyl beta-hydroxylase domain-containing protein [Burkholderiales bacterium]MBI3729808.1 aspartyl/asparaginyl beta-hydroxylase domain-containing protein [Burkholderiales bacterium]
MPLPSRYLKLPFSFDLSRLRAELQQLEASEWIRHFNTNAYVNNWTCLPLRAVDGRIDHVMPVNEGNFQDTALMQTSPYLREVVDTFQCEKTSVRLMSLEGGGIIKEHRDDGTSLEDGITRLHIPITTTPDVLFKIDGEEVHFSAGDTWYLNAACLHGVVNPGTQARVHLMIDCVSNTWLEQVFLDAGWIARPKPKYDDPAIHDGNVLEVIAMLRATGQSAGLQIASRLEAIRLGQALPN